ncbi:MAG TPA: hypothetical protein VMH83_03915, partial [Candidatus Acidoferrum sp.]|nr:hypothetical protein [Candidatus Acidoferrum sp.]
EHIDEENSVGCYMNLVPLTLSCGESDQSTLVQQVQHRLLAAQAHTVPWPVLIDAVRPPAHGDGNALTNVVLALQNFPPAVADFPGLVCETRHIASGLGQHVLKLEFVVNGAGWSLRIDHAAAVVDAAAVGQLQQTLLAWLQQLSS